MNFPISDGKKIIFTLQKFGGYYNIQDFQPIIVSNKINYQDIENLFNEIYIKTSNFSALRYPTRYLIAFSVLYFILILIGIAIELGGFLNLNNDHKIGAIAFYGFALIAVASLFFICAMVVIHKIKRAKVPALKQDIESVLVKHKIRFSKLGFNWIVPNTCEWLELWMNGSSLQDCQDDNDQIKFGSQEMISIQTDDDEMI